MAQQNGAPQAARTSSEPTRTVRAPESRHGGAPMTEKQGGDAIAELLGGDPPRQRKPSRGSDSGAERADAETDIERAARASLGAPDTDTEDEDGQEEIDDDEQVPQRDDDAPDDPDAVDDELDDDERREAEEREAEQQFLARKVKVKVDGKTIEVPVSEAVKGYQRHADYSRKTEEVARARTEVDSHLATVMQQRQALDQVLQTHQDLVVRAFGQEPDWDALYLENPLEFTRQRAAWERRGLELGRLQQIREHNAAAAQQEHQGRLAQHFAAEGKRMIERNPEWADPVKGKAIRAELESYAESLGYPKGSLEQVMDARHLEVLHKSMRYDQLLAKVKAGKVGKPDPQERRNAREPDPQQPRKPRTAVPGAAATPPPSRAQKEREQLVQAKKQAARTGRVEDAGSAIARMLD